MRRFPLAVWLFALFFIGLTSLPHLVAITNTPQGWQYSGALAIPEGFRVDYNSHLAKMWQGARGQWDYQLLFTHEEHAGLPTVQGFYVGVGAVAGLLRLDFGLAYHLARVACSLLMILALWRFACYYFEKSAGRWLTMIFGTLVGGWGWVLFVANPDLTEIVTPIEFWLIDAYNFLGAMFMPHFAAAIALQIMAFLLYEHWRVQPNPRDLALLTVVLALDAVIQPYVVLLTFPLFGLLTAYHIFVGKSLRFRAALGLVVPALAHGGVTVYQFVAISGDPIWAEFTAQNNTLSPAPIFYVLGYLPLLIPIVAGLPAFWKTVREDDRWLLPLVWVLLVLVLLYVPFPTQRRYLLGVQTPLAVLTALGWLHGIQPLLARRRGRMPNRRANLALIPYVALGMIAPLLLVLGNVSAFNSPEDHRPIFYTADEQAAYAWVRENSAVDALFLASFDPAERNAGGALVAQTGRRVFMGHWIETAFYERKADQLRAFYAASTPDEERVDFLLEIGADYIWYDAEARTYGGWNPAEAAYVSPVFEAETLQIYEVRP